MENGQTPNIKKKHFNARWVLIFSCVLIMSVMVTFGMTMAYFGGRSSGLSGEFQLKSGITLKNKSGSDSQKLEIDNGYMVPGTNLTTFCLVTVTSGVSELGVFNENAAVNGLMRVQFTVSGDMGDFIEVSGDSYNVYKGTTKSAMTSANLVCKLMKHSTDGYWYFVDKNATGVTDNTLLYDIPCLTSEGVVSLVFSIEMQVNNTYNNGSGDIEFTQANTANKTARFEANYKVIQSEFYSEQGGINPLDQNYKNAKPVFDVGY